jgi:hypothetical protein
MSGRSLGATKSRPFRTDDSRVALQLRWVTAIR